MTDLLEMCAIGSSFSERLLGLYSGSLFTSTNGIHAHELVFIFNLVKFSTVTQCCALYGDSLNLKRENVDFL